MHKALLPKPYSISLDDTALSNNTSSTKQKLKQQQIPSPLVSALRNQESGHPEVVLLFISFFSLIIDKCALSSAVF